MVEIVFVTVKTVDKIFEWPLHRLISVHRWDHFTQIFFLGFSIAPVKTENWFPYKLGYYSGSLYYNALVYIYYFTCIKNKR